MIRIDILNTRFCYCPFTGSGFPAVLCLQIKQRWWFSRGMNAIFVQRGQREKNLIPPKWEDSKLILSFHWGWKKNSKWQQNGIAWYLHGINYPAEEMCWGQRGFDLRLSVFHHCQPSRSTKVGSANLGFTQGTRERAKRFFFFLTKLPRIGLSWICLHWWTKAESFCDFATVVLFRLWVRPY